MQTVIDQTYVFFPKFSPTDLSFKSPHPNERRSLPFSIVPQSVEGRLVESQKYHLRFEYLIDEPAGRTDGAKGISLAFGKHSNKLLSVTIEFADRADFFEKLRSVREFIDENFLAAAEKDGQRHYFLILRSLVSSLADDLERAPAFLSDRSGSSLQAA